MRGGGCLSPGTAGPSPGPRVSPATTSQPGEVFREAESRCGAGYVCHQGCCRAERAALAGRRPPDTAAPHTPARLWHLARAGPLVSLSVPGGRSGPTKTLFQKAQYKELPQLLNGGVSFRY